MVRASLVIGSAGLAIFACGGALHSEEPASAKQSHDGIGDTHAQREVDVASDDISFGAVRKKRSTRSEVPHKTLGATVSPHVLLDAKGKGALVTGAAGFVGSHVARHCLDLGMHVVALDDLSGGFLSNVPTGATFIKGDVKDAMLLERIFTEHEIHYVYHLGAYAAEGLSHFIRSFNYRTNLVGSVEILNQAVKHRIECFVFTSSIAVYGGINDLSQMQNASRSLSTSGHKPKTTDESKGFVEDDRPSPEDPYGIAKFAFELDLHAARELFGVDFVIFRPHNVYGPHQNMFDKYRNVVGIFINQVVHGKPMTVFGTGEQVRAFSYIDDVAPVISRGPLAPEARNQIFNVGGEKAYTINQLTTAIKNAFDKPEYPIDYQPARLEVEVAVSNHAKVKEVFGTPEAVTLDEGLKMTMEWYKSQGKFFKPVEFVSVEVKDRMPPSWVRSDLRESSVCKGSRVDVEAAMDSAGTEMSNLESPEAYLEDEDVAFWVAAFAEINLMPGALRTVRQFYPHAPILVTVDGGGATVEFEKMCKRYRCTVRESDFWSGTPHSTGRDMTGHNFTCAGYITRFSVIETFAPSAKFVVVYEPDNRMLSRIRVPRGDSDMYQYGNMGNPFPLEIIKDLEVAEGFPDEYSTAGGTLVKRSAIPSMLERLPALNKLLDKHKDEFSQRYSQDTCLFMLAGLSKLQLIASPDVMQSTESCHSSSGLLYSCYRCIHTCKLYEDCYRHDDWLSPMPKLLRPYLQTAYYAVAQPFCWVMSEPCSCVSHKAAQRANACIQACSYTCPSMIHNLKGISKSHGTFIDCGVHNASDGRGEL